VLVRYIASLVLLFIFSLPVMGQEIPVSIDPTKDPATSRPDFSFKENTGPSLSDVLKLDLNRYNQYFPSYWNTYANKPEVLYVTQYKGLHGLIYKHTIRAITRYYDGALANTWATSHLSYFELGDIQRAYALKASEPRHRWWSRQYFFHNYPIEKGGSRISRTIIGRTYEILSLGPLALTNAGKVSWSGWRLSISPEKDFPTKGFAKNLDGTDHREAVESRQSPGRYSFGISPPKGNLYTGDSWSISGSLRLGVKTALNNRNKSSITGTLKILGHMGLHHRPWIAIAIKGKAQPISQDYGIQVSISLLTF